jgi:WhiB family redox-sensing transcriptional regulator
MSLDIDFSLPPSWTEQAACVGYSPEMFFPEKSDKGGNMASALAVCKKCPVQTECLKWALDVETFATRHGVFGGLTAQQRAKLVGGAA